MSFNKNIDASDFEGMDFGFELLDAPPTEESNESQSSAVVPDDLQERMDGIESKLNMIANLVNNIELERDDDTLSELINLNGKVDRILSMETNELSQAINEQGASIRAVIDEVEERKGQLNDQYKRKIAEVEKLVLPLLINLTKNPEREYIKWPNRVQSVQTQIDRILEVTRSDGD